MNLFVLDFFRQRQRQRQRRFFYNRVEEMSIVAENFVSFDDKMHKLWGDLHATHLLNNQGFP
jgi:hypothetical protein